MQRAEAHVYFLDTIGLGDCFFGTTYNDVRYCVEGYEALFSGTPDANPLPAKVVLHFAACQGGNVIEGYAIYNYLRGLSAKGVTIECHIEGLCASIAVLVALAADTVLMSDAALLMVHKPTADGCGLDADAMRGAANLLDLIQAQLVGRYVTRTGMSAATANDLINRTTWMGADEALGFGFVSGKLHETPLAVPTGAQGVLNYFPTTNPATMATLTATEKTSFLDELKNELKAIFTSFKNEAPAPVAEPAPVNAATQFDVTGGDPMYCDGAELTATSAVYSDEALTTAYPDGDYSLADGREVTVLAGVVDTIEAEDVTNAAAANVAALEAANVALTAELATLKADNALQARQVTGLKNKIAKTVPGGGVNPTPAGAQNIANKAAAAPAAAADVFTIRKY